MGKVYVRACVARIVYRWGSAGGNGGMRRFRWRKEYVGVCASVFRGFVWWVRYVDEGMAVDKSGRWRILCLCVCLHALW